MKRIGWGIVVAYLVGATLCGTDRQPTVYGTGAAAPGYVLFSPLLSTATYLIDKNGKVVHAWDGDFAPGASVYLLDDGHLLRPARDPDLPFFTGGGQGGRIQEFTWEGRLVWDFVLGSRERMPHHDIAPLPNGHVLAIVWERKSRAEAIRLGRRPERVGEAGLWPDCVLEIVPRPPTGGEIVWEWHVWDHLIQDRDPARPGHGRPSDHPQLVDVNGDLAPRGLTDEAMVRLQALGYLSPRRVRGRDGGGLSPHQLDRLQPLARPDRPQRLPVQRAVGHRSWHHDGAGRGPLRRPRRPGRRPPLSLGQSPSLRPRSGGAPAALRPARRQVDGAAGCGGRGRMGPCPRSSRSSSGGPSTTSCSGPSTARCARAARSTWRCRSWPGSSSTCPCSAPTWTPSSARRWRRRSRSRAASASCTATARSPSRPRPCATSRRATRT